MSLELLKVLVQPVLLERDPDGRIVGEQLAEPQAVYDLAQLADYIEALRDQLQIQQEEIHHVDRRDPAARAGDPARTTRP